MVTDKCVQPLVRCMRRTRLDGPMSKTTLRTFTSSSACQAEVEASEPSSKGDALDPFLVASPRAERKLLREKNQVPIGSRRRRAAMKATSNIPFEQLPFQCFQEARAILLKDRQEKIRTIENERKRIESLQNTEVVGSEAERKKATKLSNMREHLNELKILADINDPMVKKKFEDGQGDMDKPIYRHLADQKWRSYERKIVVQRIEQMKIVPDILQHIDPVVSTSLSFNSNVPGTSTGFGRRRNVPHGDFVESRLSEHAPHLQIQPYMKGEQLVTIALINPDVPNVARDSFDYRCHYLACNIPISPTSTSVSLGQLDKASQVVHDWFPAFAQKGASYQRMAIIILAQPPAENAAPGSDEVPASITLDVEQLKSPEGKYAKREKFILRSLVDRFRLKPIGAHIFRTEWDEDTAGVMQRAGVPGWDVEFKRKRIDPLPYKRLKGERYR